MEKDIKATDLMIGNYITDVWSPNGMFKVTELEKDKVHYGNGFTAEYGNIRPIPLTEDVLLKCGFKRMNEKLNFFILGYEVNFKIDKKIKWVAWCNTVLANVEIKYLHQLQNLFKSLTQTDLNVKL